MRWIVLVWAVGVMAWGCGGDGGVDGTCGDGVLQGFEECDDGNDDPYDGCHECRLWEPPSGEPVTVTEPLVWQWVEVDGARCRDGSPAGFAVNMHPEADKVVIYLEGGGACFEEFTCGVNPANTPVDRRSPIGRGIFDRAHPDNPLADWHWVYVHYCTGDVFAGTREDVMVPEVGVQQFVGYDNVGLFLDRIVPTFADAELVLLTGVSAGGYGAAANFQRVVRDFQGVPVVMLDDSGPPMSRDYIAPCLQAMWRELYGFERSMLADCGAACPNGDDYVLDLSENLVTRYPDATGGLFSHTEDYIIRLFYGFGLGDCALNPLLMPTDAFGAGLDHFRGFIGQRTDRFGTFYAEGWEHTCIVGDCFYETVAEGVALTDWVGELVSGSTSHVGP
jgi:cysteine-rich repeat protein